MFQMKLLKSKVLWQWFWNIYQVNEIYQSAAQITGELIKIFFFSCTVGERQNPGEIIICKASFVFWCLI